MNLKSKRRIVIVLAIVVFAALWFSDLLPRQAVKLVAGMYLAQQEDGRDYRLMDVEYSPAHDCYFAYFGHRENPAAETRNIGVYYRWLPFDVYFDSAYPG